MEQSGQLTFLRRHVRRIANVVAFTVTMLLLLYGQHRGWPAWPLLPRAIVGLGLALAIWWGIVVLVERPRKRH